MADRAKRPLSFDIVVPKDGPPHLRIRAKGNRKVLAATETYASTKAAEHVIDLIVEAVQSGEYVRRTVKES